jgi:enoyl-CoA hydratase/carnithine racemase
VSDGVSASDQLSECVTLTRPREHVALVTIDRPEARNAVNVTVVQGLARAVDMTESDVDTWVTIITGAGGKAFCAGADLKEVAAGRILSLRTE